jgi:endonuclease VIII
MPEGHSIWIATEKQNRLLKGKKPVVTSPQGRFGQASEISGQVLQQVEAAGKHLFYHFKRGQKRSILHVHLGRLGRFRYHGEDVPFPSPNCRLRMHTPGATIDLSGPTACHLISEDQREAILARLGPDPLRKGADPDEAWRKIHVSRKAIGALLLDQSLIAGLGNIFRAEILFRLGLHPAIPGNELTKREFNAIWKDSVAMLKQAVTYGWIITTTPKDIGRPLEKARGGRNGDRFYVYHRQTCRHCRGKIQTLTLANRTIYFCPECQPARN